MEVVKPERSVKTWTLFCFFLLVYFFNALWYLCVYTTTSSLGPTSYGAPGPSAVPATDWFRPDHDNLSFLSDTWRITRLVDLHDFQFLINVEESCGVSPTTTTTSTAGGAAVDGVEGIDGNYVFALVFVHSAPAHFEHRRAIRNTWGSYNSVSNSGTLLNNDTVRVVFMLGMTTNDALQSAIMTESRRHGDVVQGNFMDSYRNLTYKHVMGLKWVSHFCRHARYVFKVDDDVFVDVYQTIALLRSRYPDQPPLPQPIHSRRLPSLPPTPVLQSGRPQNLIMCFLYPKSFVKRSHRSKWQVAVREYSSNFYPPYCAGWGIVMSTDLVLSLYRHSSQIPYFWIDDVVVSGILAERVGAKHVKLEHRAGIGEEELSAWVASSEDNIGDAASGPPYTFGVPDLHASALYALWNKTLRHYGALRKSGATVFT